MSGRSPSGYSFVQIILHWLIAVLVVLQILFAGRMEEAFRDIIRSEPVDATEMSGATLHVVFGLTILALALIRLVIRLTRGAPPLQNQNPALRLLAAVTHVALYAFIIGMPLSGATAWFLRIEDVGEIHAIGRFILVPLIILHAIGALAEHFVFRNGTLKRMLRPQRS